MRERTFAAGAFALVVLAGQSAPARAHHPAAPAPSAPAPHAIGGLSEISLSIDVTQYSPPSAESVTLWRLRGGVGLWIRPWIAVSGSVPVQSLTSMGESEMGLGNAALGAVLRGIYPRGLELLASTELRLPTFSEKVGAHDGVALVPQLVLAHRSRVTSFAGVAAAVRIAGDDPEPGSLPRSEAGSEILAFTGASLAHGRLEGRAELRFARALESGSGESIYVGAALGLAVRASADTAIGLSAELPVRAAGRMEWSAALLINRYL